MLETRMAYLDLGKYFDRVDENKVWQILKRK